jgi:hypothetical protein
MTVLYAAEKHLPLGQEKWDAGLAREAIARIVAETRAAASDHGTWPVHPQDGPEGSQPLLGLYLGSAGVIWALDQLTRAGHVSAGDTFAEHLPRHLIWNEKGHRKLGLQTHSYFSGAAGILLCQYRTAPSAEIADDLATVVADNAEDPTLELMWGAPGTMIAALAMHAATGEPRWAELFRAGARTLDRSFVSDPDLDGAHIWTQDLYGQKLKFYGLVHGFAGVAFTLIAGRGLLAPEDWARWSPRLAQTLAATAVRDGPYAIWYAGLGPKPHPDHPMLVQACHGSPGMVIGLAELDQPIDDLLIAGGELTWAAGPLEKGPGLCHGTAGNGYAFLKLHARTGDPKWLDRARAFAMHAIAQSDAQSGGRRFSLWTGDLGVALYLADCINGVARFPTLDVA